MPPGMPMDDMPMDDMDESEPTDEFETFAVKAWPDMAGDSERIMAAKEAIKICLEQDQAGDYDSPKPKKGGSGLALIFGAPKKGK